MEDNNEGQVCIRDRLVPGLRVIQSSRFAGLQGRDLELAYLLAAIEKSSVAVATGSVRDRPASRFDCHFWQFPSQTEGEAWRLHDQLPVNGENKSCIPLFLGLPWATWIDKASRQLLDQQVEREILMQRVRLRGLRKALKACGVDLRVHTVCQHIYWRRMVTLWRELGVTDLWLSHAPAEVTTLEGISLHPWRLYAANIEDPARRAGLVVGVDPASKPLLASFVGSQTDAHPTNVRSRLRAFSNCPRFHIELTDKWHFEQVVYQHQIDGQPLDSAYALGESVRHYNRVLSDSIFSLCPSGSGPNTIRLWESLAVGSVPVLLGERVVLPRGGDLPNIEWDEIVLRVPDQKIDQLPTILQSVSLSEVRKRQQLGVRAFRLVQQQRCFST